MSEKEYLNCDLCNETWDYGHQLTDHLKKERHIINYFLYLIEYKWKKASKDRHGVSICVTSNQEDFTFLENKSEAKSKVKPLNCVRFVIKITNKGKTPIFLEDSILINPVPYYKIEDKAGVTSGNICVRIKPGISYFVEVVFEHPFIGTYLNVLALNFTTEQHTEVFTILKRIIVDVNVEENLGDINIENYISPYMYEYWNQMTKTHRGFQPLSRGKKYINQQTAYSIPREYREALRHGLKVNPKMPPSVEEFVRPITDAMNGGSQEFEQNYDLVMHALLYLEEYDATKHINQYNMSNIKINYLDPETVTLQVPGLGEKRPSLILGDVLYARVRIDENTWDTEQYQGQIAAIKESFIHIGGFIPKFMEIIKSNLYRFDVRFELSRNQLVRMHKAIDLVCVNNLMNLLFPKINTYLPLGIPSEIKFFNQDVVNNPEQLSAIMNIISGSSRPYPYIIFGPPGTGKTVTLVEAILQVVELKNSRVLACAPSNSACDVIASKLRSFLIKENEILRVHSTTRDWKSVPDDIKSISNYIPASGRYYSPSRELLQGYKVIVSTLMSSSRLLPREEEEDSNREDDSLFTHVFIDECGQAQETEALVAIGGQLGQSRLHHMGGQLILAGDPQQLGPICASKNAEMLGLGTSYLERLMSTCVIYQKSMETGEYDPQFITKLRYNFRSHPSLLYLPNQLFYENDLEARCPAYILNDPVIELPFIDDGLAKYSSNFPIIFHGCIGQEMRDGRSPSFINYFEIDIILQYIKKLVKFNFPMEDVGIISPYARQVYKLKENLRYLKIANVEVGSTETFQGREKRLIIISTVRSIQNNLAYDAKFRIGFLADRRRFNVALTRAQSLNIIVGNPYILSLDKNWNQLINYAFENKSYTGVKYMPRNEDWLTQLMNLMKDIKL